MLFKHFVCKKQNAYIYIIFYEGERLIRYGTEPYVKQVQNFSLFSCSEME